MFEKKVPWIPSHVSRWPIGPGRNRASVWLVIEKMPLELSSIDSLHGCLNIARRQMNVERKEETF
jgi:hypothetical protein